MNKFLFVLTAVDYMCMLLYLMDIDKNMIIFLCVSNVILCCNTITDQIKLCVKHINIKH